MSTMAGNTPTPTYAPILIHRRGRTFSSSARGAGKTGISLGRSYPRESIGAAWPAWEKRIAPVFGDVRPDTVTLAQMSEWRAAVARALGDERSLPR